MESQFGRTHPVNTADPRNFALVLGCDDTVGTCCKGRLCGLVCAVCVRVDVQTTEKQNNISCLKMLKRLQKS